MTRTPARDRAEKSDSGRNVAARSARRRALTFVGLFVVLAGLFFAIAATPWWVNNVLPPYLSANAHASAAGLRLLGEQVTSDARVLSSPRMSLSIERGCDAVDPMLLYAAALLALPGVAWRKKLIGLGAGWLVLAGLNLVRIMTLYYVGIHRPRLFELMHVEVWQTVFVFLAVVCWMAWAWWATKPKAAPSHPATPPGPPPPTSPVPPAAGASHVAAS